MKATDAFSKVSSSMIKFWSTFLPPLLLRFIHGHATFWEAAMSQRSNQRQYPQKAADAHSGKASWRRRSTKPRMMPQMMENAEVNMTGLISYLLQLKFQELPTEIQTKSHRHNDSCNPRRVDSRS
eukprot:1083435-Amphidinium_carterae.1